MSYPRFSTQSLHTPFRSKINLGLGHKVALGLGVATLGAAAAWAAFLGPLVQVSGVSPFGPLAACGSNPGTPAGVNFLNSEVEPWIDVNPTNADNIVAYWQQDRWSNGGSRGLVAGVSLDGGATWSIVPVPGLSACSGGTFERASDPWVSFAPDGTLHQISLSFDADPPPNRPGGFGPNALLVSKSTDGGLTWSAPITIIRDDDPAILNDKESITADPTDSNFVYAVWDRLQVPNGSVINPENVIGLGFKSPFHFARSTDGGNTWEPARRIYDPGANNQTIGHQLLVLPNGTLVDFFTEILNFRNDDHGGQFDLNLSLLRSADKGVTWLPNGRAVRTNKILSRGTSTPDNQTPVRDADILFDVAVDALSGTLYAVWQDSRFTGLDAIAFSRSTDGGATWSTPIKVNQTPSNVTPRRQQAFVPSVAVRADGTLAVTYYDFRNDDATAELADYFGVFCANNCNNPASWGNEVRLTDASFDIEQAPFARGLFLGDYAGLTADSTDFLPAFAQAHGSDPASIFFRRFAP